MERAAPILCGSAVVAVLLVIVNRDYPIVGHDFRYFIPRLLDTYLHLRINGPSIQWYTPSFGGGLPAFPNPQHVEYSLLQALLYVASPWTAFLLATTIVSAIGYTAFYAFLSRTLGFERIPSALGAAFLVGNGFYIEHMIVGHVGFQLFPMGAVILSVLANRTRPSLTNACLAALIVAMMVHHAGFYLLILTAVSIVLAGQVVFLIDRRRIDWAATLGACVMTAPLALAIAGSKIFAIQSMMRQFPREVTDRYAVGALHGLAGLAGQLAGVMTIAPALMLAGVPLGKVSGALIHMTGANLLVWEQDIGLSPVLTVVLLVGVLQLVASVRRGGMPRPTRDTTAMLIALAVTSWIAIEATLARGLVYPVLRTLPVFRSLHVNTRIAAVFILPLTIVGAALLNRWYLKRPPRWHVAAALALTLALPLIYLLLPGATHQRFFDVRQSARDYERIGKGERFPIGRIEKVEDFETFSARSSSLRPYEPLFGYFLEIFAPRIHSGGIDEERDGLLNMTNPSGMVFPEINGVRPFDRIRAADRLNLERLATRRQPDWHLPSIVPWLNIVAVTALAVCAAVPIAGALGLIRRSSRRRRP